MFSLLGKLLAAGYFSRPIFVVGAGRSGTTALLHALGKHPKVLLVEREAPLLGHIGRLAYYIEPNEFREYYLENLMVPKENIYYHLAKLLFESCNGNNYGLQKSFNVMKNPGTKFFKKRCWVVKSFPTQEEFLGLRRLFPDSRYLYLVRNGINMVHSRTQFHGFKAHGFLDHCRTWTMNIDQYSYIEKYPDVALEVRHELLVEDPQTIFTKILKLIGIEQAIAPVDFISNNIIHPLDKPTQYNVNVQDVIQNRKPPWCEWTDEEREIFKSVCGENMNKFGYEIPF
ncbi:sulfotransferase [Desulfococcaceae bacterium HSG7]|nr:sulfotransferase [Desulfococcaceae bacterium HSG7]